MSSITVLHQRVSTSLLDEQKGSVTRQSNEAVNVDSGVDVAAGLLAGHTDDVEMGHEEYRRLRMKLDWHILPLFCLIYTCIHFTVVRGKGQRC